MPNTWEEAINKGNAFEVSAVLDGAYAIPAYKDIILNANSGEDTKLDFAGFFINADNNPVLVEFWEGASFSGGDGEAALSPINRNRNSPNSSKASVVSNTGYATALVRTGGTLLTQLTIFSGVSAFDFANIEGLMEKWDLKPNTNYTVRLRNNDALPASVSARMLWLETSI